MPFFEAAAAMLLEEGAGAAAAESLGATALAEGAGSAMAADVAGLSGLGYGAAGLGGDALAAELAGAGLGYGAGLGGIADLTAAQTAASVGSLPIPASFAAGAGDAMAADVAGLNGLSYGVPPSAEASAWDAATSGQYFGPTDISATPAPVPVSASAMQPDYFSADAAATASNAANAPPGAWDSVTNWWNKAPTWQKMGLGLMALNAISPKSQIQAAQPYTGGNLQYFKYDPRTYQPAITMAPTPYAPQYRHYAEGGGVQGDTALAQGQMPGALDMQSMEPVVRMATGGIANLGSYSDGGRLLRGPGDGMSDNIPANISGKQPARLADGEFVVPADVVSGLGNGSTDAGAKQLYKMLDRVRSARTGTKKQGREINPNKFTPS